MTTSHHDPTAASAPTLTACKVRALLLLKDLRSEDRARAEHAAERLRTLPYFRSHENDAIIGWRNVIRLEHAEAVIAAELGYASWADCQRDLAPPAALGLDTEAFFTARSALFLNRWFARYDEARVSLEAEGGYLFPFRHQFFICEGGFLEDLGIDPADPDWAKIGRDWVQPHDQEARDRLERKLKALGY